MQLTSEEYYTPPSQEIFDDIKQASIKIWETYSDVGGYSSGKINSIKDLKNISDNYGYIIAMFDHINQSKLPKHLKLDESKKLLTKLI